MNTKSSNRGITFTGLLQLIFITLKLLGKITWPWVWVLSPIWVTTLTTLLIIAIVTIMGD